MTMRDEIINIMGEEPDFDPNGASISRIKGYYADKILAIFQKRLDEIDDVVRQNLRKYNDVYLTSNNATITFTLSEIKTIADLCYICTIDEPEPETEGQRTKRKIMALHDKFVADLKRVMKGGDDDE